MDMKISDLIKNLEKIKEEHGDVLVTIPSDHRGNLHFVGDENLWLCRDSSMHINIDYGIHIDELEYRKVLVIGEI